MKWVGNDTAEPPNQFSSRMKAGILTNSFFPLNEDPKEYFRRANEARLKFQIGPPQPTPAYSVEQLLGFGLIGLYDPERQEDFRHALPILYDAKLAPDFTAAIPSPPPECSSRPA
jgi:hypothetical protein